MAHYTTAVIERERPDNRLLRAFILYKVLTDWLDDCRIVINSTTIESQRKIWWQHHREAFWKAQVIEAYLERELAKCECK